MTSAELHTFLFQLYDFAELLADKIESGDDIETARYFPTLL